MDIAMVKDIVIGAAAVLSAGLAFWTWLQSPSKANADAIQSIADRVGEHDRRIQTVEDELKHLPDKDEVMELKLAISDLKGVVGRLEEQVGSVGRTVHRIDDYLRSEKA